VDIRRAAKAQAESLWEARIFARWRTPALAEQEKSSHRIIDTATAQQKMDE